MRSLLLGLVIALAASCGDNNRLSYTIETRVPKLTLGAGERIAARCAVLDAFRDPVLDEAGEPLTDSTEFTIAYKHEDSFAMDVNGEVIAAKVGEATVQCIAPGLGLEDENPELVTIVPGPPVRVITDLAK